MVYRKLLILCLAGWKYKEVAKEFGTTIQTVKSINLRLAHADIRLTKEELEKVKLYR